MDRNQKWYKNSTENQKKKEREREIKRKNISTPFKRLSYSSTEYGRLTKDGRVGMVVDLATTTPALSVSVSAPALEPVVLSVAVTEPVSAPAGVPTTAVAAPSERITVFSVEVAVAVTVASVPSEFETSGSIPRESTQRPNANHE
jgi:hypothetical protein